MMDKHRHKYMQLSCLYRVLSIDQTLQFMLQINRQYRQDKPSSVARGNRIQALKLMGYHYIQQNNKKFSSRLIYVLLEGLVQLYTRNTEAQLLLTGSQEDRAYVGEAIELLMKEKIQGKIILGSGLGVDLGEEVQKKNRRIEQIQLQNKKLKEALKEQREKYQKEVKKGNKLYQKCQHITDMLFEMKEKHQLEKKSLEEQHVSDLQIIIEENKNFSEQLIRQKTIISVLKEQKENLVLDRQMKSLRGIRIQKQQLDKRTPLVYAKTVNALIEPKPKHLKIKQQYDESIQPLCKSNMLTINKIHSSSIFPISKRSTKPLFITKQVHFTNFVSTTIKKEATTSTESSSALLQESRQQNEKQTASLCLLNRILQRRLSDSQQKLKEREQQYQKLVRHYNNLYDELEEYKIRTCSNIEWLSKQLQRSLLNTEITHERKSTNCMTSIDTSSESETDRLHSSRQSTDRCLTPINRVQEESVGLSNSFVLRQRLIQDSSLISKQVISTYVLQLMDRSSQGETKEVMIDQIGACLGWGEKEFERIDLFRRKVKNISNPLRQEEKEARGQKQGIGDRFYRFLTLQSDTQE